MIGNVYVLLVADKDGYYNAQAVSEDRQLLVRYKDVLNKEERSDDWWMRDYKGDIIYSIDLVPVLRR